MKTLILTFTVFFTVLAADLARAEFTPQFDITLGGATGAYDQVDTGTMPAISLAFTPRWGAWGFDLGVTRFDGAEIRKKRYWWTAEVETDIDAVYMAIAGDAQIARDWKLGVSVGVFTADADAFDENAVGLRTKIAGQYSFNDLFSITLGPTAWLGTADNQELVIVGFDFGARFSF